MSQEGVEGVERVGGWREWEGVERVGESGESGRVGRWKGGRVRWGREQQCGLQASMFEIVFLLS